VADFTPDDLSREIDRLWARVGSASTEPLSASSISATAPTTAMIGSEAAWETVALLKRQQRQRESSWQQTMAARDEALLALRARLESAETELGRLRLRSQGEDERTLVGALNAQQEIETAQKSIALAEARYAEERRALEDAMQSLRERIAAETARARTSEQRAQAREQQNLLDLKELQGLVARREQDVAAAVKDALAAEGDVHARDASLAEAKNAIEKTLSELLIERKERERAQAEREAALKKVDELRAHMDELSRIWEEERAQWRELWDRERSTWETQRGELAHWEENLRREREAWHAELQAKEKAHLEFSDDLTGKIRETLTGFPSADASEGTVVRLGQARVRAGRRRRWALAVVVALVAAAAAVPAWRAATVWRFTSESVAPAPTGNPTGLAYDGNALWISDWSGRLVAVDPADPRRVLVQSAPQPGGPYHPTAIAAGGGALWTLDAAQSRLVRHSAAAPDRILAARPSPGPAPAALAFDGETVWSYDAVNRALTRHGGDDAPAQTYALPDEAAPNAMTWADGRLWIYDAKARRLLVYEVANGKLSRVSSEPAPEAGVLGLAAAGAPADRRVYVLVGPSGARGAAEIVRDRLKRLIPFAHF
jgi:outer membrane protein assembly factor BamB